MTIAFELIRREGRLVLRFLETRDEVPVRPVWARPLSGRGQECSFIDDRRREVAMVESLDHLDPVSRRLVEEEIDSRYLIPRILRILELRVHLGVLYWSVETDRGPRRFAMRDPAAAVTPLENDRVFLRDTMGNRYEIESLRALDEASRMRAELVL